MFASNNSRLAEARSFYRAAKTRNSAYGVLRDRVRQRSMVPEEGVEPTRGVIPGRF